MKIYFKRRDMLLLLIAILIITLFLLWIIGFGQGLIYGNYSRENVRGLFAVLPFVLLVIISVYILFKAPVPVIEISEKGFADIRLNADVIPWSAIESVELFEIGTSNCKQPHVLISTFDDFTPIIKSQRLLSFRIPHGPVATPFVVRKIGLFEEISNIYYPVKKYFDSTKKNDN